MFKFVFACLTLCFLMPKNIMGLTEEQKAKIAANILEVGLECVKEYPITNDDVSAFREKKLPTGDNAACFTSCIFKGLGIMDESGKISQTGIQEHAKKVFSEEEDLKNLDEFISACLSVNEKEVEDGEKGCDRAKLAFSCLVDNSDKFGFNFDF